MWKQKEKKELATLLLEKSRSEHVELVFEDKKGNDHTLDKNTLRVLDDILEQAFIPFLVSETINAGYGNIEQALTEFAEKLKDGLPLYGDGSTADFDEACGLIDKILKEILEK